MNVYFISGVAADRQVFRNICLPPECNAHHLDWIAPKPLESLKDYALRLAEKIDRSEPFVLVGLSLGGMMANEIARVYHPMLVVLISSVPSSKQLPPYYHVLGRLGVHKMIPISFLKSMSLLKRLFTAESKEEKRYLRKVIRSADNDFIRWSLDAIVNWNNEEKPSRYIHIHGSQDYILPVKYSGCTHLIKGGGHLMVLTRAREISEAIAAALKN